MSRIIFYGASDDLIEIEGDVREEFTAYEPDPDSVLAISDGTLLGVEYDDDGVWRFKLIEQGQGSAYNHEAPAEHEGELPGYAEEASIGTAPDYSDVVWLDNEREDAFKWVVLGQQNARAPGIPRL